VRGRNINTYNNPLTRICEHGGYITPFLAFATLKLTLELVSKMAEQLGCVSSYFFCLAFTNKRLETGKQD